MLSKLLTFILLTVSLSGTAFSQSAEIGLFLGTTTYKGEINSSLFLKQDLKPAVGILYHRNFNNHWSYRFGLNYGHIYADDANTGEEYKERRNLSFRSRIFDFHGLIEFNFFPYQVANPESRMTPFIFGGLNVFYFNPQAQILDEWYELQPQGTEGQGTSAYPGRKKYSRITMALPFGGGFKFRLSNRFGVTIEAGARRLFTDYLDDISTTYADQDILVAENGEISAVLSDRSIDGQQLLNADRQRGNASDNDWYMFAGITLNYTLSKKYSDNCTPFKRKLR